MATQIFALEICSYSFINIHCHVISHMIHSPPHCWHAIGNTNPRCTVTALIVSMVRVDYVKLLRWIETTIYEKRMLDSCSYM